MRKVSLGMNITLDGFVASPDGGLDWMFAGLDRDVEQSSVRELREIDTFLMGRRTYEGMAAHWPQAADEIAAIMNSAEKVVFSKTLAGADWAHTRISTVDAAEEIARLKSRPGNTIAVAGGAALAGSVAELGLVDEYRLTVHPVALGDGLRLFDHRIELELVRVEAFRSGVVTRTYRPA